MNGVLDTVISPRKPNPPSKGEESARSLKEMAELPKDKSTVSSAFCFKRNDAPYIIGIILGYKLYGSFEN